MSTESSDQEFAGIKSAGSVEPGASRSGKGVYVSPLITADAQNRPVDGNGQSAHPSVAGFIVPPRPISGLASPSSPQNILTDWQRAAAAERRLLLLSAQPFLDELISIRKTAAACGVPVKKLWDLVNLAGSRGNNAAKCRRLIEGPLSALAPKVFKGRDSDFSSLLDLPAVVEELHRLYAATMGASCEQATRDRRTGSIATTLLRLGDFAAVPPQLAGRLRAGARPRCLVDHIRAHWTPEMEAKFRGQKHYAAATICGRRDLVEELSDGSRVPLQPGRVWVLDDMSSNIPFWFEVEAPPANCFSDLKPLIERHGCALGRQGLYAWDWASGAWLGLELVGRFRDAYTAADILRFLRKLMQTYGKPDKIVIERGVWKAHAISGWSARNDAAIVEIEDALESFPMAGDETARINQGIRDLGVEIIHAYTSRGKPIEGAFNYHQTLVPTFFEKGEVVNIGRHAGEFEWSAREHRRASAGVWHPAELGFVHIDRLADVSWQAMVWEGNHDKGRRDGKPLEILGNWLSSSPLPSLDERDRAVFLPEKRNALIRDGHLSAEVNGVHHDFLNPEMFAAMGDGMRVDYAFDPAEPTLGAAVYGPKGFLCWADYLPAGPVISARDRAGDAGPQLIKRYKLAHRTAARLLDLKSLRTVKYAERRSPAVEIETPARKSQGVALGRLLKSPTPDEFNKKRARLAESAARSRELIEMIDT